jgi:hypothetical protein
MILDDLVKGSIDMHCHFAPDAMIEGRMDAYETVKRARDMGMGAVVLKSTYFPTIAMADIIGKLIPEIKVFGAVCLDYELGGLNYEALEPLAKFGTKVVWMPTHSSTNSRSNMRRLGVTLEGEGFSLTTADNKMVPEMAKILAIIKKYNMVIANGHISPAETFALVEAAHAAGIDKIIITHGLWVNGKVKFTLDELKQLGQMGCYIEHCYVGFLPTDFRNDPKPMVDAIRYIGAEHCIMGSDLGQWYNPPPSEGMRMFIALMLKNGITPREIEYMVKENPAKLLDIK